MKKEPVSREGDRLLLISELRAAQKRKPACGVRHEWGETFRIQAGYEHFVYEDGYAEKLASREPRALR